MQKDLLRGINLYLIGMMGSGKTTVGRILAEQLGYRFVDTDALIEQVAEQTITQIFAESGEAVFRELETSVLSELSAYTRLAIATGGGIVTKQENWGYLHYGLIVWLDVPIEQLFDRIKDDTTRPLLQTSNPFEKLQNLLEQRSPLYAQADVRIIVKPQETPEALATRILEEISTVILPPQTNIEP
jgi:shikimate kinase